jgi:membrane protease YdiL (CAAX protease family)
VIPGRSSGAGPEPFPSAAQAAVLVSIALALRVVAAILFGSTLPSGPSVLGMSAIVGLGAAFAVGAAQLGAPAAPHLGLRRPPALAALAVPLLVPWVLLVSELDNYARVLLQVTPESEPDPAHPSGPLWIVELVLVLVVALPVTEELLFRGLLQPGLVTRLGRARGILLVCVLDALVVLPPLEPRTMLFAAALALPLALLRQASGSLWLGLALHMSFGAVAAAAELGLLGIPGFDDMTAAHTPAAWVAPAAASALAGFAVCFLSLRRARG